MSFLEIIRILLWTLVFPLPPLYYFYFRLLRFLYLFIREKYPLIRNIRIGLLIFLLNVVTLGLMILFQNQYLLIINPLLPRLVILPTLYYFYFRSLRFLYFFFKRNYTQIINLLIVFFKRIRNIRIRFFRTIHIIFIVVLIVLFQKIITNPTAQYLPSIEIKSCYDGDTCTTTQGERIRLACINAPELSGEGTEQILALEAKAYLNYFIAGSTVKIRRITKDYFGRTVAELSKGHINIQEHLVKKGYAIISKEYANQCEWSK